MEIALDYISLMHSQNQIGNSMVRFSVYNNGDTFELLESSNISFIFVLQGEAECVFATQANISLKLNEVTVINKMQLKTIHCKGNTLLFEFNTPSRMELLMMSISRVFGAANSEIIPLNKHIHKWCKSMLIHLSNDPDIQEQQHIQNCHNLTNILLNYPKQQLGTLYIPLYAFSNKNY